MTREQIGIAVSNALHSDSSAFTNSVNRTKDGGWEIACVAQFTATQVASVEKELDVVLVGTTVLSMVGGHVYSIKENN